MNEAQQKKYTGVFAEADILTLSLGKRLEYKRKSLGLSQEELCRNFYLSQGYYSQIENDLIENLGFEYEVNIARSLGLGINFFEGKPDNEVFLRPEARNLNFILTYPRLPAFKQNVIKQTMFAIIPQTGGPYLEYIDYNPSSLPLEKIILRARENEGMTQGQAAEKSSLSQGYFCQLENGAVFSPPTSTLRRLSDALGIDLYTLMGLEIVNPPLEIKRFDKFLRDETMARDEKAQILNTITDTIQLILDTPKENLGKIGRILSF